MMPRPSMSQGSRTGRSLSPDEHSSTHQCWVCVTACDGGELAGGWDWQVTKLEWVRGNRSYHSVTFAAYLDVCMQTILCHCEMYKFCTESALDRQIIIQTIQGGPSSKCSFSQLKQQHFV